MDNHYHLLLETREANLSRAMQWLQTSYSMWFNRKYGRVGPLFEGRFKAIMVDRAEWGLALSRYLHLNPVRVKILGLDKPARAADPYRRAGEAGGGDGEGAAPAIALLPLEFLSPLRRSRPETGLADDWHRIELRRGRELEGAAAMLRALCRRGSA
jgi:hypothetical protein